MQKKLILFINNNKRNYEKISNKLAEHYCSVNQSGDADLISLIKKLNPDCIFLNYKVGKKSWDEIFSQISPIIDSIEIPVVIFGGENDQRSAISAIKKGVFDYLTEENLSKEFLRKIIQNTIEKNELKKSLKRQTKAREQLEDQLLQAQKMEAIGQLAGGVAHDFNNLLQIINGYTEILLRDCADDKPINNKLNKIYNAGQRAKTLINQLLSFSRRQIIRKEVLNPNNVIAEILVMLKRVIEEHIKIKFSPKSDLANFDIDRGMIEQVVMNICVNARDAMPKGGKLSIFAKNIKLDNTAYKKIFFNKKYKTGVLNNLDKKNLNHSKPGYYIVISIIDTGEGISGDVISRIFEPFFTTKVQGKGTGLGLSTAYGILRQHNGAIAVESTPGHGAKFDLYFPVHKTQLKKIKKVEALEPRNSKGGERILIAEDDELVQNLMVNILTLEGYSVITASNGEDALEMFEIESENLDLIILDVVMPLLGGYDVYKVIKSAKPEIPILFTSGYSEEVIDLDFLNNHNLQLLRKPFSYQSFLEHVKATLG